MRFTCCPPLVAILNCKAARVNRFWAAVKRFSQYIPSVRVIDLFHRARKTQLDKVEFQPAQCSLLNQDLLVMAFGRNEQTLQGFVFIVCVVPVLQRDAGDGVKHLCTNLFQILAVGTYC